MNRKTNSTATTQGEDPVRIAFTIYPPLINRCPNDDYVNCPRPGSDVLLLLRVLRYLGVNRFAFLQADVKFHERMLINGSADVSGLLSPDNYFKEPEKLYLSPPLDAGGTAFVVKSSKSAILESNLLFRCFDYRLGLVTVGILVSIKLANSFLPFLGPDGLRAADCCLWLVIGLLFGVYSNFLSVSLNVPPSPVPRFASFAELAKALANKDCSLVTPFSFNYTKLLLHSKQADVNRDIDKALPEAYSRVRTEAELGPAVLDSDRCLIGLTFTAFRDEVERSVCSEEIEMLHFSSTAEIRWRYAFRRSAPFVGALRSFFSVGSAADGFSHFIRRFNSRERAESQLFPEPVCRAPSAEGGRELSLAQLVEALWLAVAGSALAFLTFALEYAINSRLLAPIKLLTFFSRRGHQL